MGPGHLSSPQHSWGPGVAGLQGSSSTCNLQCRRSGYWKWDDNNSDDDDNNNNMAPSWRGPGSDALHKLLQTIPEWTASHFSAGLILFFWANKQTQWFVVDAGIKADTKWQSRQLCRSWRWNPNQGPLFKCNSNVVVFFSLAGVPLPQPAPTRVALMFTSCS